MDDIFWWKTYRTEDEKKIEVLEALTRELGRLPTEDEARRRVQLFYSDRCPDYPTLMRPIAVRVGMIEQWKELRAAMEEERRQRQERMSRIDSDNNRFKQRLAAVQEKQELERSRMRSLEQATDFKASTARRGRPPTRKHSATETVVAPESSRENMHIAEIDLSEVEMTMKRHGDAELLRWTQEMLAELGENFTCSQATSYFQQHELPTLSTFQRRLGPPSTWPERVATAVAQGVITELAKADIPVKAEVPVKAEALAEVPTEPVQAGAATETLAESRQPDDGPERVERATEEAVDVQLSGVAHLRVNWGGKSLLVHLHLGDNANDIK